MLIDVHFLTSTTNGFDRQTAIAHCSGASDATVTVFAELELPAILQFATEILRGVPREGKIVFHSRRNTFRNAFECRWILDWIADGFKSKPAEYRYEWAVLHSIIKERGITVCACELLKDVEHRLEEAFRIHDGKPRRIFAPGDPFEMPWSKEPGVDELIDRAIKRDP